MASSKKAIFFPHASPFQPFGLYIYFFGFTNLARNGLHFLWQVSVSIDAVKRSTKTMKTPRKYPNLSPAKFAYICISHYIEVKIVV